MQIKDVEKLKAWLLTRLEPLCDADPAALAKYVVALLRKDKPKSALRELCVDQLEVFLAKETTLFVDRLFRGLDSESYLTGQDSKTPPPSTPPIAQPSPAPPTSPSLNTSSPPPSKPAVHATKPPPSSAAKPQSVKTPPAAKPQTQPTKSRPGTSGGDGTQSSSSSGAGRSGGSSGDKGEKGRTGGNSGGSSGDKGEKGRTGGNSGGSSGDKGEKGRTGGNSGDRRHLEDLRSREVDDDDRDFRRSRNRDGRPGEGRRGGGRGVGGRGEEGGGGRGGGKREEGVTVSREPDSSTGGGRKGAESDGGRARAAVVVSTSSVDHRGKRRRGEGEVGGGVTSTAGRAGEGRGRRPVKDRTGSWQDDRNHGDNRSSRRSWQHRSRSRSCSSDSDSSTSSNRGRGGRKRSRLEWSERGTRQTGGEGRGGEGKVDGVKKDEGEGGRGGDSEIKRRRCKDYDEKGFCMLGDQCPFDHGVDPVVIGNNIPHAYPPPPSMVGIPSLPLTKPGFLAPPPPVSLPGRLSPTAYTEGTTDGYNPEEPALTATTSSYPSSSSAPSFLPAPLLTPAPLLPHTFPPPPPHHPPHLQGIPSLPPPLPPMGAFPPPPLPPPITSASHHQFLPPPRHLYPHRPRQPHMFAPSPWKPSDTLIVRKIPRELNTVTKLSSHFEKFGTVVNLTVWYSGDPEGALVQFSTPFEARKAHDSAEAVLNNRFIRIYYLRKDMPYSAPQFMETSVESPTAVAVATINGPPNHTHSQPASNLLTDHTPSLSQDTMATRKTSPVPPSPPTTHAHTHPPLTSSQITTTKPHLPNHSSAHSYVNTNSTSSTAHFHPANPRKRRTVETGENKEMVKKRLELQKKTGELLQKQIDQQKLLISKLEKGGKQMPAEEKKKIMKTLKNLSTNILKLKNMASDAMELKLRSKPAATQHPPSLTEKAQALRREAHQLGLISSPSQPLSPTSPTSTRWTGSARGYVTGSGSGHVKDLRAVLDQKPKSLLVINAESREQLTAHFDAMGGLLKVEMDPECSKNLIFTFRHAHLAQKAAKGTSSFNGKSLIMKWYTPKPSLPSPSPSPYSHPPKVTPSLLPQPPRAAPSQQSIPPPPLSLSLAPDTTASDVQEQVTTPTLVTPTLTKLDPEQLHLVEDDEDEESEGRSWRR